jgi:hypothetical protein
MKNETAPITIQITKPEVEALINSDIENGRSGLARLWRLRRA